MSLTVEQLLATLGIDLAAVEVSTSGRYVLIQRDPQPDETGIDIDTDVVFTLVDLDGDPTDASLLPPNFDVDVEGNSVLSYSGGSATWTSPWTGTVETHTASSPFAFWKVIAQQTGLFESEQVVQVQIDLYTTGGWGHGSWGHFPWGHPPVAPVSITFQYEFTIQDLTPPKLIAAEGMDPFTLRVTFDEDMALAGDGSPLNIDNWLDSILRWNVDPEPGVNLSVVASEVADSVSPNPIPIEWTYADEAERLAATGFQPEDVGKIALQESDSTYWMLIDYAYASGAYGYATYGHFPYGHTLGLTGPLWLQVQIGTQFDLTLNWEMTPGCSYQITAGPNTEDDVGNLIDTTYNTTFFTGFMPEYPEGRAFSHWKHMVPLKNRLEDATQDLKRTSNCIQEVLNWMMYYIDHFTDQWDPDKATPEQIDAMLYDMGNPFASWTELELTDIEKKKLLRILIDIYKSKGTAWGIEQTVYFLLGEIVDCVEYLTGGWVLGVDELGSGSIAEVMNDAPETWDFTAIAAPWELEVKLNGDPAQVITFTPGDFANTSAAKADEVIAVIAAQLVGGSAYKLFPGQPAVAAGTNLGTFAISPGDSLGMIIGDDPTVHTVIFTADDIATPGAATVEEIVSALNSALADLILALVVSSKVSIETVVRGDMASLEIQSGSVQAALGLPTAEQQGTDLAQLSIYSNKAGVEASVEISGGSVNDALEFDTQMVGSTGGAILAPDDSYTMYSFDIETQNVLTSEETSIVRKVAEYMKPAHTHLIEIRTAQTLPWPDGWVLGVDALDETAELAE